MKALLRWGLTAAAIASFLGCPGSRKDSPAATYVMDLQPPDGAIPPTNTNIFYVGTLLQNGSPTPYPAEPEWTLVDMPSYPVGTLTPQPASVLNDPAKRSAYYQSPGSLPQGVSAVNFRVRCRVTLANGQVVEASRRLTLDLNAPQLRPREEGVRAAGPTSNPSFKPEN